MMIEVIENKMWCGKDPLRLKEDGKSIYKAINNMKYLYNIDVTDCLICSEELNAYVEGHSRKVDELINKDLKEVIKNAEKELKNIKKKEEDEFFEDRVERFKVVLAALKKDAKLVYSI